MKRKIIQVFGAGQRQGIGPATARRAFTDGYDVFLFDIDEEGARKLARKIDPTGRRTRCFHGDITNREDVQQAVNVCVEDFGVPDIAVFNAGGARGWEILGASDEEVSWNLQQNFFGTCYGCQALAPLMQERGDGSLVFVSSVNAEHPCFSESPYALSKTLVQGLCRCLAAELAPSVRVNCVAPASVRALSTNMMSRLGEDPEYFQRLARVIYPLDRVVEPDDVADAIMFLGQNRAITGQILPVDCGFSLGGIGVKLLGKNWPKKLRVLDRYLGQMLDEINEGPVTQEWCSDRNAV
jgi:NAD(P)-dependent dehydrogenase (short-subunit alcohol dehydrogenase family)